MQIKKAVKTSAANKPVRSNAKVGYKSPPKETRYKPGQSGNPSGRPKGPPKNLKALIHKLSEKTIKVPGENGEVEMTYIEFIANKFWEMMSKGDPRYIMKYFEIEAEREAKLYGPAGYDESREQTQIMQRMIARALTFQENDPEDLKYLRSFDDFGDKDDEEEICEDEDDSDSGENSE